MSNETRDAIRENLRRLLESGASLSKLSRSELEELLRELLTYNEVGREFVGDLVEEVRARSLRGVDLLRQYIRAEVHREIESMISSRRSDAADLVDRVASTFGDLVRSSFGERGRRSGGEGTPPTQAAKEPQPDERSAAKESAPKKSPAKATGAKKSAAKKSAPKKSAPKKSTAKTAAKKSPTKKRPAKAATGQAPKRGAGSGGKKAAPRPASTPPDHTS